MTNEDLFYYIPYDTPHSDDEWLCAYKSQDLSVDQLAQLVEDQYDDLDPTEPCEDYDDRCPFEEPDHEFESLRYYPAVNCVEFYSTQK